MKIRILYLIFFLNITISVSSNETLNESQIHKNLRCLVCQGQSIYDSDSEFANSLKLVVKKKLESGDSEEQIYDFLQQKYGEWILYDPQFNKNTYFLWLLPILMFILGGAIIFMLFIKKKN